MKKGEQIHFTEPSDVALWCAGLGVSRTDLFGAISAVGYGSTRVVAYLLDRGAIKQALAEKLRCLDQEEEEVGCA